MYTREYLERELKKQKEINKHISEQLRLEMCVTNAFSRLKWVKSHQNPRNLDRLREALKTRDAARYEERSEAA